MIKSRTLVSAIAALSMSVAGVAFAHRADGFYTRIGMRERLDTGGPQIRQLLPAGGEDVQRLSCCISHPIFIPSPPSPRPCGRG